MSAQVKLAKMEVPPKGRLPELGKLKLDDFDLDLDYFLKTDYTDANSASAELPAVIEWVNSKLQAYTEEKILAKSDVKQAEGKTFFALRSGAFETLFVGKPTETAMEYAVAMDDSVRAAIEKYAVLCGWVQRLSNLIISLQAKLDLVRTAESTRRALIAGDDSRPTDE